MNVFAIFTFGFKFLKLIPFVVPVMKAVEEAIPGDFKPDEDDTRTKGEIKLAMARGYLEEFWGGAEQSFGDFSTAWPYVERIINRMVPLIFRKKEPA